MNYPADYRNEQKVVGATHASNVGTGFAQAGYSQQIDVPAQPRFEAVADHLANLPSIAMRAIDRLRLLADRYGGAIPEPISKAEARGVPNSLSAKFEQSTTDLDLLLGQIHAQIDRLERF